MRGNTDLGVVLERRLDETFEDYTDRIAVTTLYAARDRGLPLGATAKAIADVVRELTLDTYDCV